MGSAVSIPSHRSGSQKKIWLKLLLCEAQKPLDLSDLGSDIDISVARAEVARLRSMLHHFMSDEEFVVGWLRPRDYRSVTIPIPSSEDLKMILDAQIKKKAVLMARAKLDK